MLDRFILKTEYSQNYFYFFLISFFVTLIISVVNYFIGGNSLFLVALVSLSLAYPVTNYARRMDRKMIDDFNNTKSFLRRYKKELILFWTLFLGVLFAILISVYLGLVLDFTYQKVFVSEISGDITNASLGFGEVFFNNLEVGLFTFIISFLVFSGLIFVLVWNASILAYYLFTLDTFEESVVSFLFLLPHGLLEIGGYIFAGIAGAILAYRIDVAYSSRFYKQYDHEKKEYVLKPDRRNTFSKILNKRLFLDFFYLLILAFLFIFIGAFVETV